MQMTVTDSVLGAALEYYRLGWCIIPIRPRSKAAEIKWGRYQQTRPDPEQISEWFGAGRNNIAVVLGDVSGGLTSRDYDVDDGYDRWATAHPDLAGTLPTARTSRGHHVYFLGSVEGIRHSPDGELRGAGGYCIVPPSIHPSGTVYRRLVPPTNDNLFAVDPEVAGFAIPDSQGLEHGTQKAQRPQSTQDSSGNIGVWVYDEKVDAIIQRTLPRGFGRRNRALFDFAHHLLLHSGRSGLVEPCSRDVVATLSTSMYGLQP